MSERMYLPTLGELIDRLSILSIKEVKIPDHREEYAKEIKDILHDIDNILAKPDVGQEEDIFLDSEAIRAIVVVAQTNLNIWNNEAEARSGNNAGNNLLLTHSLNGIRNRGKNRINYMSGERLDPKTDSLASEFTDQEPSW